MWLAPLVSLLALVAVDPRPLGNPPPVAPTGPAPTFTNRTVFTIPFHIDRPARLAQEPVEVQLYVSSNRGAAWQLYGKTQPAKGFFVVRAAADGEYWFLVRTLDRSGQVYPSGPYAPELIVLVDTIPPKVQLDARRGPTGEVVVHWQIDEIHPRPGSLAMLCRTAPTAPWQPLALGRPQPGGLGAPLAGEVNVHPPTNVAWMEFRGEVVDLAGNPGVGFAQIRLQGPPNNSPSQLSASANGNAEGWRAGAPDPAPARWPPTKPSSLNELTDYRSANEQAPPASPLRPGTRVAISEPGKTEANDDSVAIQISSSGGNQFVSMNNSLPPGAAGRANLPQGPRVRMINKRVFELEYDVESVGPSGVQQVELWCTRDNARTWSRFAVDRSKRSPMVVTVPEEGTYGFSAVVQNGAGVSGPPPRSGQQPEIWIVVDLTKPAARITSAMQGSGAEANSLIISWEASDQRLAAAPISLSFGLSPAGPWNPIATGLENTGHYAWAIDGRTPSRLYLRLEARDEAGNVGTCVATQPVVLDISAPKAHILDVRPVGQSGQRLPESSYLR